MSEILRDGSDESGARHFTESGLRGQILEEVAKAIEGITDYDVITALNGRLDYAPSDITVVVKKLATEKIRSMK